MVLKLVRIMLLLLCRMFWCRLWVRVRGIEVVMVLFILVMLFIICLMGRLSWLVIVVRMCVLVWCGIR